MHIKYQVCGWELGLLTIFITIINNKFSWTWSQRANFRLSEASCLIRILMLPFLFMCSAAQFDWRSPFATLLPFGPLILQTTANIAFPCAEEPAPNFDIGIISFCWSCCISMDPGIETGICSFKEWMWREWLKSAINPRLAFSSICQFRNHECNQSNFQVITCPLDLAKLRLQTQVRLKPGRATAAWSSSRPLHHDFRQLASFFWKQMEKIPCYSSWLTMLLWFFACVHYCGVCAEAMLVFISLMSCFVWRLGNQSCWLDCPGSAIPEGHLFGLRDAMCFAYLQ